MNRAFNINAQQQGYKITFFAMASPCEVLVQSNDLVLINRLADKVTDEVWRIEDKYSRYKKDSVCSLMNNSAGRSITIDNESFLLLNFAKQCYQLSEGLFDITSGVLNRVWCFDGSDNIASHQQIEPLLPLIGLDKVCYQQNSITVPKGMSLDFGGIAKEYAVDRCIILAKAITKCPILVNLGGDLAVTGPRRENQPWQVAIEALESTDECFDNKDMIVTLFEGALATSGDSKRYLYKDGKRYSHVLNPITGWPIEQAPRSITVLSPQCIQAGMLATMALLQGRGAEAFLAEQEITYWLRKS